MTEDGTVAVQAHAPGRVNLIGDHTDYAGGLALPCAIDLGITVTGTRSGSTIEVRSESMPGTVRIDLAALTDPSSISALEPPWGRHVAAIAAECGASVGLHGTVTSDLPVGAGLSSSAALGATTALALGFDGDPMDLALLCQRAEFRAVGVPVGLLDQMAICFGRAGHALLLDFSDLSVEPIPVPEHLDIAVVHSGQERELADSQYAERRASCERAAAIVGALPAADAAEVERITDETLRRRARHVVSECGRVRAAAHALRADDAATVGALMTESHRSLRDDFEVSTNALDDLVDRLIAMPGVHGARLTGAGFGGCVVALAERGSISDPASLTGRGWIVRPSAAAAVTFSD